MYRIIKTDGVELGMTDFVNYIKINDNGTFISVPENEAIGVAFDSTPYNLVGHNSIADAETVVVSEVDNGALFGERPTYAEMATAIKEGVNLI